MISKTGIVKVKVTGTQPTQPISNASIRKVGEQQEYKTDPNGECELELLYGLHEISVEAFGQSAKVTVDVPQERTKTLTLNLVAKCEVRTEDFSFDIQYCNAGEVVGLRAEIEPRGEYDYEWSLTRGSILEASEKQNQPEVHWDTMNAAEQQTATVTITDKKSKASIAALGQLNVRAVAAVKSTDAVPVSLRRVASPPTEDQPLWVAIRNRTKAISFSGSGYESFINKVLCKEDTADITGRNNVALNRQRNELYNPVHGVGAFELLKTATQVFLLMECGTVIREKDRYTGELLFKEDEESIGLGRRMTFDEVEEKLKVYLGTDRVLPYIDRVLKNTVFKGRDLTKSIFCEGVLGSHAECPPMLELIWSYWHEEGMLVQSMNAISLRFQNRRSKSSRDPLAHLEIAPLYPVNNLVWGYLQDEIHRLSVTRRNYEYNHHYGLGLYGQAVSDFQPADPRSKFLEGFHNLLYLTTLFFKQADDTTVVPDGFPILNALREVHLVLAEGAHNQFGDLPWTARAEMLMQQWILARPEMREFLQSRAMVPYREGWMAQVDTMKHLQGWTDVSITHFNFLATYGEQILLSIRYGDWIDVTNPAHAANWASYWRPEIQGYIHAYRAATGVDLATAVQDSQQSALRVAQPSELLRQRLPGRGAAPAIATGQTLATPPDRATPAAPQGFRERRAARRATNGRGN